MNTFTQPLMELNEFREALQHLQRNETPVYATGCIDSQKSHLIYALSEHVKFRVIITYNDIKAKEIYEDFKLYDTPGLKSSGSVLTYCDEKDLKTIIPSKTIKPMVFQLKQNVIKP